MLSSSAELTEEKHQGIYGAEPQNVNFGVIPDNSKHFKVRNANT